jgi:hypothetical protein
LRSPDFAAHTSAVTLRTQSYLNSTSRFFGQYHYRQPAEISHPSSLSLDAISDRAMYM